MASWSLITNTLMAKLAVIDISRRMYGTITPFHCAIEFDFVDRDRVKTIDDFQEWHIHPAVSAALCYAENGAGPELVEPENVQSGLASSDGIEARVISAYIIGTGQTRHRLDIRYSA